MFNNCVYPWWLSDKESTCNAGDAGSIPGLGRSSVIGNGNPFQYSCLGNLMDKGAWKGCKESESTVDSPRGCKESET